MNKYINIYFPLFFCIASKTKLKARDAFRYINFLRYGARGSIGRNVTEKWLRRDTTAFTGTLLKVRRSWGSCTSNVFADNKLKATRFAYRMCRKFRNCRSRRAMPSSSLSKLLQKFAILPAKFLSGGELLELLKRLKLNFS